MKSTIYLIIFFCFIFTTIPVYSIAGSWTGIGSNIIYNEGNIGVGTNNPESKLQLNTNSTSSTMSVLKLGNIDNRYWEFLAGKHANSSFGDYSLYLRQPADKFVGCEGCGGDLVLEPWQNTIITRGNLGIGIGDPTARLHVASNAGALNISGSDHTYIQFYPDGMSAGRKSWVGYGDAGSNDFTINNSAANGNIVLTPSSNFSVLVNGRLKAKEIRVKADIWADHVFSEEYNLMSLDDLENYIIENKHLPNIPSEKIALEGDLNLIEINVKLLEKVEELTLYSIQLNKEIKALKSR